MFTEEEVKAYKKAVLTGKVKCTSVECPVCEGVPDEFAVHERRRRWFCVIVGAFVERLKSLLIRWKCPMCGTTFTQYPPFALPHKRYVRQAVETLAEKYVREESCTYRDAVKAQGGAIGYKSEDPGVIDERQIAPSTLWRWLSFLGGLKETLRRAHVLIRAMSSSSPLSRKVVSVAPHKYRTIGRRNVLRHALRLVYAGQEYRRLFGISIFPDLATGAGWM